MYLRSLFAFLVVAGLTSAACTQRIGDQPVAANPSVLGPGKRLRDVQAPNAGYVGKDVLVTSAVVTAVDGFDETNDGKSRGTIWLQDVDVPGGYGGISLFSPSFQPANLRLAPGDVVDLDGQYVEQSTIGATVNFAPAFLPQLVKPSTTFRYETAVPTPIEISLDDLMTFDAGRKWIGLLVTIKGALVEGAIVTDKAGRRTAGFTPEKSSPAISNELFQYADFPPGTTFQSVTGIVTFFFTLKIAPRSDADLVK
ncbi:hypothetical protein BH09MYX1_BH09MYX1_56700 [soil metagenome]